MQLENIKHGSFNFQPFSILGLEQMTGGSNACSTTFSREKRASIDVIGSHHRPQHQQRQIIIPDIQFSEDQFSSSNSADATAVVKEAPKLLLSSATPTSENVVQTSMPEEKCKRTIMRPSRNWRSQTAFELSSSVESEASAIVSEFLTKTGKNDVQDVSGGGEDSTMKLESYV